VRQGKPLAKNLRLTIKNQPLVPFYPQKQYLSLIGTGDSRAIALWGKFYLGAPNPISRLLWIWKDRIDRKFMQQFKILDQI
jgi:selenide,water dikinase